MKNQIVQPVFFEMLKIWIPLGILLVSGGIAWGSVQGSINLANSKIDTILAQNSRMGQRISAISDKQTEMAIDIAKLQQIIQDAQTQGLLSKKNSTTIPDTIASSLQPIPTATPPQNISYNTSYTAGQSADLAPQPTAEPKPTPSPQQTPTPMPELVPPSISSAVFGILGL